MVRKNQERKLKKCRLLKEEFESGVYTLDEYREELEILKTPKKALVQATSSSLTPSSFRHHCSISWDIEYIDKLPSSDD